MLYIYLIFLCIGVYASCKPILNNNEQLKKRITGVWEIQKDFCAIEHELYILHKSKEIPLDIPKDPKEGACARFNLNTFIKLLNQSSMKISPENEHYNNMLNHLKSLAEMWPDDDGRDTSCTTTTESNLNLKRKLAEFLLQALPTKVCLKKTICPPSLPSVNPSCHEN